MSELAGTAADLADAALAERTVTRYRRASDAYLCAASAAGADPCAPTTLLVWLHSRTHLDNTTLRIDVNAIVWALAGRADPGADPDVRAYLAAHARVHSSAPDPARCTAVLDTEGIKQLLTAPWPAERPGGELLIARGVATVALLAAAGADADPAWVSRIPAAAVTDTRTTASAPGPDGHPVSVAATGGPRCPLAAIRTCVAAGGAAGTGRLLGWSVTAGTPTATKRPLGSLVPQLRGALGRAGHRAGTHPANLSAPALARLCRHVDPSHLLELRTRAFVAVAFVTAARHDDLSHVERPRLGRPAGCSGDPIDLWVARSKADQAGIGHDLVVDHLPGHGPTCPGCHLEAWLAEIPRDGPLFPALGVGARVGTEPVAVEEMNDSLRRLARGADLDLAGRALGTRTMRTSHISVRAAAGETPEEIAETTHQTPGVVYRHYVQPLDDLRGRAQLTLPEP